MKTTALATFLCAALVQISTASSATSSYAISVYRALTSELVFVYGPIDSCDSDFLANLRQTEQPFVPPSLVSVGARCVSRTQIQALNLNPPVCAVLDSKTESDFGLWEYGCFRGYLDRFVNPPTAAELEQQRKEQAAQKAAQEHAEQLAAERAAERLAWTQYAAAWSYQRDKVACLMELQATAPRADNPQLLCDRGAKNRSANHAMDLAQYCAYMRAMGEVQRTISAACDTQAAVPFGILPPKATAVVSTMAARQTELRSTVPLSDEERYAQSQTDSLTACIRSPEMAQVGDAYGKCLAKLGLAR